MAHAARQAQSRTACALMTALLAVCAQIQLPLPGVPMNLALFAVHLGGMLLGPARAAAAVGAYLCLGLLGVPVFSGFAGGPAALLGPTGGFLFGYLLCALITGAFARRAGRSLLRRCAAALAGTAACTLCGILWFMHAAGAPPTFSFWWLIYLPGDLLKLLLAALLAKRLDRPLRRMGMIV